VLDGEVVGVVENSDNLAVGAIAGGLLLLGTFGRDGDGVERHRLGGLRGDFSHVCDLRGCRWVVLRCRRVVGSIGRVVQTAREAII